MCFLLSSISPMPSPQTQSAFDFPFKMHRSPCAQQSKEADLARDSETLIFSPLNFAMDLNNFLIKLLLQLHYILPAFRAR